MEYLGYALIGVPFVFAVLMGLLVPLFLLLAYRNVGFGIALTAALCAFEVFFPRFEGLQLGIRLYVPDIVTGLLALTAFLRFLIQRTARPKLPAWYFFLAAIFISMGVGFATLGSLAGVAARPYFYAIAVGSYALTFPGSAKMVRQLIDSMAWFSIALMLVVLARWIITFAPIPDLLPDTGRFSSSEASLLRVVTSEKAIILAQLFVVSLFYPLVAGMARALRAALPLLFIMVVALQHRSVWLAMMSAVAARFALPQAGRKATVQLLVIVSVVVVVVVPLAVSGKFGGASEDITRSADRAVAMSDTADARLGSWGFMLRKWADGGPRALLVGLPMGTSAERTLLSSNNEYAHLNFQAHNYYVQTIFSTGLWGIGGSIAAYAWILLKLFRGVRDDELGGASGAMLLITVAQVVYYIFYGVDYMQGLILGVAGALALTLESRRIASEFRTAEVDPSHRGMAIKAALRRPRGTSFLG